MYVDGGSRGNPGHSAVGVVLISETGETLAEFKKYIGLATNNIAEYQALLEGLKLAKKYTPCSLAVYTDSELMCNQMTGSYKVKNEGLLDLV